MISRILVALVICSTACLATETRAPQRWLDLLYYEPSGNGYTSAADAPEFFVTSTGKTDPDHEYAQSLRLTKEQNLGFRQKFPLRYRYLTSENQLPYQPIVIPTADIESVTMAFPNRYLGNPASMFGHLFIVLHSKTSLAGSDLVHFLAETNGTDPQSYVYNGLVGNFKGAFLVEPFHKKIKEYYNLEDREVRYYSLALSPAQIETLQLHLIELRNTFFYYYFLDENCAYFTGKLLNIVTEKPILTKSMLIFPSQIINALNHHGLLKAEWRRTPSSTLFNQSWNTLTDPQHTDVMSLYTTPQDQVPTHAETLRSFVLMADYMINTAPDLAQTIRHNRILAYQTLGPTKSRSIRPDPVITAPIAPIVSNRMGIGINNTGQLSFHYNPICYGENEWVESLARKSVNYLGTNVVLSDSTSPMAYLTLAALENIPEWTPIRPEQSWRINSQLGFKNGVFTNQSFELGQTYGLGPTTLGLGMIGLDISNFDPLLQREWDYLMIRPSVTLQLQNQLIKNTLVATVRYENRFGNHRYIGECHLDGFGALTTIQMIHHHPETTVRVSFSTFF